MSRFLVQPDLILTDLVMAGMSGLEVIRRVMQQPHRLPVVLMTADGSPACRMAVERAGAAGFMGIDKHFVLSSSP